MDKQKGLAPILIVLLIALGIGGYLIYQKQAKPVSMPQQTTQSSPASSSDSESTISAASPAPNGAGETANWKIYTDTQNGFSLKYPSTWSFSGSKFLTEKGSEINLVIQEINLERAIKFLNYGDAGLQNKTEYRKEKVSGVEVVKAEVTLFQREQGTGELREDSRDYRILIPLTSQKTLAISSKIEDGDILDQILSTFRFD